METVLNAGELVRENERLEKVVAELRDELAQAHLRAQGLQGELRDHRDAQGQSMRRIALELAVKTFDDEAGTKPAAVVKAAQAYVEFITAASAVDEAPPGRVT